MLHPPRWLLAYAAVRQQIHLLADVQTLHNPCSPPAERLRAVVRVHMLLHNHPHRVQLLRAARAKRGSLQVASQALLRELVITGG